MSRYFIEVAYKGTAYAGFQKQENANTIQAEVEKALGIYFRSVFDLTGSSRTDAGVHAHQNYFHFDHTVIEENQLLKAPYHLNAILPEDIVVKRMMVVKDDSHCRFDAAFRRYEYSIYNKKDPFLQDRAYYFPYKLDEDKLNEAAALLLINKNFKTFSKRNTQVHHFECRLMESKWDWETDRLCYRVSGNRFLRGMVRGMVGTMLRVGTGKMSIDQFKKAVDSGDCKQADFAVPPQGLVLLEVKYPQL